MSERAPKCFNEGCQLPEISSDCLWLIIDGIVKNYTINQEGKTIILGFWGKQQVVGKSLSNVDPYFIQCLTEVKVISIPTIEWNTISDNLLDRIIQIQQLSTIIQNPETVKRLWLLLEWLGKKFGLNISEGLLIDFPLTPQDLADALGMEQNTVRQIIDCLKQEGRILQLENQRLVLKNTKESSFFLIPSTP